MGDEIDNMRETLSALEDIVQLLIKDGHADHPRRWPARLETLERQILAESVRKGPSVRGVDEELGVAIQTREIIAEAIGRRDG